MQIVFQDHELMVVDKPAGILSQPGKTMDGSIATQARDAFPDATGPMLVHRLDMDTSGLLILAKNAQAHRTLQQQFEKRQVYKEYEALVERAPNGIGGHIQLPLRLDIHNRPTQIMCMQHGKHSSTLWRRLPESVLASNNACSAVVSPSSGCRILFIPITGRSHQLRVHAAHQQGLGAPIIGDRLYGEQNARLMLHARHLSFNHPITEQRISVESRVPF